MRGCTPCFSRLKRGRQSLPHSQYQHSHWHRLHAPLSRNYECRSTAHGFPFNILQAGYVSSSESELAEEDRSFAAELGLPTGDDDLQSSDSSDADGEKTVEVQGNATADTTKTSDRDTGSWGAVQFGGWQGGGWEDNGVEGEDTPADGREARKDGGDDGAAFTSIGENILDGTLVGGSKGSRVEGERGG